MLDALYANQMNTKIWQQVNVFAGHEELFYCPISYHMEERERKMVVVAEEDRVNHGGTTSRNGQASHCHRCCVSQTIEVEW